MDDYPYKRLPFFPEDIKDMFNELKKYKAYIREKSFVVKAMSHVNIDKFNNPKNVCILEDLPKELNYKNELIEGYYAKFGYLTDYFTEPERIRSQVKNINGGYLMSSYDYWQKHKNDIKEEALEDLKNDEDYINSDEADKNEILQATMREILYAKSLDHKKYITREAGNFRITNMIACIQLFKGTKILDISMGWGDRLIGFLSSPDTVLYVGTDPNTTLHSKYDEIINMLGDGTKEVQHIALPFEEAIIPNLGFDLIVTSPPYHDFEKYSEENTQSLRYGSVNNWYEKFLLESTRKAWSLLLPGGYMCIAISDTHNKYTERYINDIVKFNNCEYWGVLGYSPHEGVDSTIIAQPIWCFHKLQ